jgi:hypothetical protein
MEFLKDCVYSGNKYRLEEFFNWGVAPKSLYTPLKYLLIRWYLRKTTFEYWKGSPKVVASRMFALGHKQTTCPLYP